MRDDECVNESMIMSIPNELGGFICGSICLIQMENLMFIRKFTKTNNGENMRDLHFWPFARVMSIIKYFVTGTQPLESELHRTIFNA